MAFGLRKGFATITTVLLTTLPLTAQELLVTFAANLETAGGVNHLDISGADLYSVRFNATTKTVSDLRRLTATPEVSEYFPTLAPEAKWVAYNYQKNQQHEIRLINLNTQSETKIFSNGRFPEWLNATELLVTYVSRDTQDVCLLTLDLGSATPKVTKRQWLTDRSKCPNTSIASDAYAFANGQKFVFHILRPNREEGAALAMMNLDGTNYRQLTNWDGSGHGVITNDGRFIACSNSQNGKPQLIEVRADSVSISALPITIARQALPAYDNRFAQMTSINWVYPAWGADERALFHSMQGWNANTGVARLIYSTFDSNWQNPQIFDFATAVEKLANKTGKDFYTVSARRISTAPVTTGVVYVTLAMHNEDNFPVNQPAYLQSRNNLIEFGKMLQRHQVAFNWESDWRFLLGVLQWDTPAVMATTGGKNIVRYLHEDLGFSIDPHSHENNGYNYADVAHLIDSLGVQPTPVVGGHIWDPAERLYQNWERFKQPLQGSRFPGTQWKGDILMGSATGLHTNDPEPSGVWRPKGKYEFWVDDPTSSVHAVGQHQGSVAGIQALVNLYKTGAMAPDKILTATIVIGQAALNAAYISNYENTTILPLLEMQNRGEIKLVTFTQLLDEWKTQYNSSPHLYMPGTTTVRATEKAPMASFHLSAAPNPFSASGTLGTPSTSIRFSLPQREQVTLKIFELSGREITTLIDGELPAGEHAVRFDAGTLPSGVYLYRLATPTSAQSKTMLLLR